MAEKAEPPMDDGTALDLTRALVTKFAKPLLRLEEILEVVVHTKDRVPELVKEMAALTEERNRLIDAVAQAQARAKGAEEESARLVAAAQAEMDALNAKVGWAQQQAEQDITAAKQRAADAGRALGAAHEKTEAELTARLTEKQAQLASIEKRVAALKAEFAKVGADG
jgi:chromosome segregation ATPase